MTLGDLIAKMVGPSPELTRSLNGHQLATMLREAAKDLIPARVRDVVCPQCKHPFELTWGTTLRVRGCPSGGIYDVSIECPTCDYTEPL